MSTLNEVIEVDAYSPPASPSPEGAIALAKATDQRRQVGQGVGDCIGQTVVAVEYDDDFVSIELSKGAQLSFGVLPTSPEVQLSVLTSQTLVPLPRFIENRPTINLRLNGIEWIWDRCGLAESLIGRVFNNSFFSGHDCYLYLTGSVTICFRVLSVKSSNRHLLYWDLSD